MTSLEQLPARLAQIVGESGIMTQASDMEPYLVDWRKRLRGNALCVVAPRNTQEVALVVTACASAGARIVPQGGNTGLCGGATPDSGAYNVVVSLRRMNRVRHIDTHNNTMTVEAGCVLQDLQQAALAADRLFPLSLAAQGSCQIGGNLSTNAGGVHVLRYGNMRDLTLGLEVVLADGRVWDGLRALRKDNTGYDLKHLFMGAEGTLGIITAAVLKLFPLPKVYVVAWVGVQAAQQAVELLTAAQSVFGTRLSAFEMISSLPLSFVYRHIPGALPPLGHDYPWQILLELADNDTHMQDQLLGFLSDQMEAGRVGDGIIAHNVEQARRLWFLREHVPEALTREGYSIKHDISIPVSRLAEFLPRCAAQLESAVPGIRLTPFGHLGDGNLHYNMSRPLDWDDARFAAETARLNELVHDLVHELGGSVSAEHGLGQIKRAQAQRYKSAVEMDLMRRVKTALDPHNLMNPGKVL